MQERECGTDAGLQGRIESTSSRALCREAWSKLGDLSKEGAMQQYVELLGSIAPEWDAGEEDGRAGDEAGPSRHKARGSMGPVFSSLAAAEDPQQDDGPRVRLAWPLRALMTRGGGGSGPGQSPSMQACLPAGDGRAMFCLQRLGNGPCHVVHLHLLAWHARRLPLMPMHYACMPRCRCVLRRTPCMHSHKQSTSWRRY